MEWMNWVKCALFINNIYIFNANIIHVLLMETVTDVHFGSAECVHIKNQLIIFSTTSWCRLIIRDRNWFCDWLTFRLKFATPNLHVYFYIIYDNSILNRKRSCYKKWCISRWCINFVCYIRFFCVCVFFN